MLPATTARDATRPETHDDTRSLGDLRFRKLLTAAAWQRLPHPIRDRFAKRVQGGQSVVYTGVVTEMHVTRAGRMLVNLARLIGAPLPVARDIGMPAVVTVTEELATGGQIWTRLYARRSRLPQVIQSSKRFAGPTGLEEHVGCGVGMSLRIEATDDALLFESERYFLSLFGLKITLPRALTPGRLVVGHHERGDGRFDFTLDIDHPRFGRLFHQRIAFRD
jgi:hypothetical protein